MVVQTRRMAKAAAAAKSSTQNPRRSENDESNVNSTIIPTPTHTHSETPAVKVSDPLDESSRRGEASASSVTQQEEEPRRGIAAMESFVGEESSTPKARRHVTSGGFSDAEVFFSSTKSLADLDTPGREGADNLLYFSKASVGESKVVATSFDETSFPITNLMDGGKLPLKDQQTSLPAVKDEDTHFKEEGLDPCITALGKPQQFFEDLAKACLSRMGTTRPSEIMNVRRRELKSFFPCLGDLEIKIPIWSESDEDPLSTIGPYLFQLAKFTEAGLHKRAPIFFFFYLMNVVLYEAPDMKICSRFIENHLAAFPLSTVENESLEGFKTRFGFHVVSALMQNPALAVENWSQVQSQFCSTEDYNTGKSFDLKVHIIKNLALYKGPSVWHDSASVEFAQALAINGENDESEFLTEMERVRATFARGGNTSLVVPTAASTSITFRVSRSTYEQGILAHSYMVRSMIEDYEKDGKAREEGYGQRLTYCRTNRGYNPSSDNVGLAQEGRLWAFDDFEQLSIRRAGAHAFEEELETSVRLKKFPELHFRMIIKLYDKNSLFEDFCKTLFTKQFVPILAYTSLPQTDEDELHASTGVVAMILLTPIPEAYMSNIIDSSKVYSSPGVWNGCGDLVKEYLVFGKFTESTLRDLLDSLVYHFLDQVGCAYAMLKTREISLDRFIRQDVELVRRATEKKFEIGPKTDRDVFTGGNSKAKLSSFLFDFAVYANGNESATKAFFSFLLSAVLIPCSPYDDDDEDNFLNDARFYLSADAISLHDNGENSYWKLGEKYEDFLRKMFPSVQVPLRPSALSLEAATDDELKTRMIEVALYIAKYIVDDGTVAIDEWVAISRRIFTARDIEDAFDIGALLDFFYSYETSDRH